MTIDDFSMTKLVHLEGDYQYAIIEAFLIARKAIGKDDKLQYGSMDVFVFECTKTPQIEKMKTADGMLFKMMVPDTMLSFDYQFHHNNELLHGMHNCGMNELLEFEKVYKRTRCSRKGCSDAETTTQSNH